MSSVLLRSAVAARSSAQLALIARSFSTRRVDRRGLNVALRRAELSEQGLEHEVRKGLDKEGDYVQGEVRRDDIFSRPCVPLVRRVLSRLVPFATS